MRDVAEWARYEEAEGRRIRARARMEDAREISHARHTDRELESMEEQGGGEGWKAKADNPAA